MQEATVRQQLREWVGQNTKKKPLENLTDQLNLIEERVITSVQILDLIIYIERLSGRSIDASQIKPGTFRNIDSICGVFFGGDHAGKS